MKLNTNNTYGLINYSESLLLMQSMKFIYLFNLFFLYHFSFMGCNLFEEE